MVMYQLLGTSGVFSPEEEDAGEAMVWSTYPLVLSTRLIRMFCLCSSDA